LRRNCLLKHAIEGKKEGTMKVTRERGRRHKQLPDTLKEWRGYRKFKEEALDRSLWSTRFGRSCGAVVRHKRMNEYHSREIKKCIKNYISKSDYMTPSLPSPGRRRNGKKV